ncbi:hypothetical protein D8770_02530 [Methylobacterium sp. DB1607]|nr:hypothetical protein [Methylobacterium sp. DB1607]
MIGRVPRSSTCPGITRSIAGFRAQRQGRDRVHTPHPGGGRTRRWIGRDPRTGAPGAGLDPSLVPTREGRSPPRALFAWIRSLHPSVGEKRLPATRPLLAHPSRIALGVPIPEAANRVDICLFSDRRPVANRCRRPCHG